MQNNVKNPFIRLLCYSWFDWCRGAGFLFGTFMISMLMSSNKIFLREFLNGFHFRKMRLHITIIFIEDIKKDHICKPIYYIDE